MYLVFRYICALNIGTSFHFYNIKVRHLLSLFVLLIYIPACSQTLLYEDEPHVVRDVPFQFMFHAKVILMKPWSGIGVI